MHRNLHKYNNGVTNFIIKCSQYLGHKTCHKSRSFTFPSSVLNDVFNTNFFIYTHNYKMCNNVMLKLVKSPYQEKYDLLMNSIHNDFSPTIVSPNNAPRNPVSRTSMKDLIFK